MSLFSNMRAEHALQALDEALSAPLPGEYQDLLLHGPPEARPPRVVREVIAGLRADGLSPVEILSLVRLILELIQTIGPIVADILKVIRERRRPEM